MGDTGLATTALLAQAGMRHTAGQPAEALRLVDQALIALRRAGDRDGELSALESRVRLLSTLGRRLEESEGLAELETLSRERGDARIQAECGVRRAQLLEDEGRSEEALGLLEPVERMARQSGNRELLVSCLHVRARVAQRRRDAREALAHWTEMERLLREAGNALRLAAVLMAQVPLLERDPATRDSALAKCREACFLYEITGRAVDLVNAKAALLRIERGFSWVGGLPVSVQRALSGLVSLAALAAGLALGLWSPWLWLLGGPLALVGVGNLLMTLFPRLHMRSVRLAERLSAEVCEEEVRRGGG
jgi:tetratricopeptide (TPR) repeat protein